MAASFVSYSDGQYSSNVQHLHPMRLRLQFGLVMLACFSVVGCHTNQPPVRRDVLVGSYTYVSKDPERSTTDSDMNHLILQSDGTYELAEGGTTKAVSTKKGGWKLMAGSTPNVLLDHSGYPVEIKGNEIRLLVDLDVGIWWVKTR
jgi:hypothetical protein